MYQFFSDDAWLSDKFGLSIRHLREAIDMLKIRKDAMARGVPELEGPLMAVANDVRQLRGVITNLLQERSNDNGNIYFDPIPSELEVRRRRRRRGGGVIVSSIIPCLLYILNSITIHVHVVVAPEFYNPNLTL